MRKSFPSPAKDSFDYPLVLFSGVLAGIGQWTNQDPTLRHIRTIAGNNAGGTKTLFLKLVMSVEKVLSGNEQEGGSESPDFEPSQVFRYTDNTSIERSSALKMGANERLGHQPQRVPCAGGCMLC
jgi:hypothetical protein